MGAGNLATICLILSAMSASLADSANTTPAAAATATSRVSFRSRQTTFTSDLQNVLTPASQRRVSMITDQLAPFFQNRFSSYRSFTVVSFRNGSVINDIEIRFANPAPHFTEIANVLVNASSKVTGFDIEIRSITVDNIVSSGANHKISLLTSFFLVLLSWLLSSKQ